MNTFLNAAKRNKKKTALIGAALLLTVGIGGNCRNRRLLHRHQDRGLHTLTAGTVILGNIADDATSTTR